MPANGSWKTWALGVAMVVLMFLMSSLFYAGREDFKDLRGEFKTFADQVRSDFKKLNDNTNKVGTQVEVITSVVTRLEHKDLVPRAEIAAMLDSMRAERRAEIESLRRTLALLEGWRAEVLPDLKLIERLQVEGVEREKRLLIVEQALSREGKK